MSTPDPSGSSSIGKRVIAALILLVAVWILIKVAIGIVTTVFWVVLVIAAIAAVIWAIRVL